MSGADPDPWMQAMRRGDWPRAWEVCDRVLAERAGQSCAHWPRHLRFVWRGDPLAGKRVLVRCYHGLGDTLQFIRYMPMLGAVAREVVVWAQPKLIPLLEGIPGVDRFLPLHDGAPEADYDVDVELMELPHVFRTTLETVPASIPYLRAEPMPLPASVRRPIVGLAWRAGTWDDRRSIPFEALAPLRDIAGVSFVVLQPDAHASGWDGAFGSWPGELDIPAYARAVRAMDLMVTVDSMPAHLAGALGVPTWTLLPKEADWRWMDGRDDSPWYPGMRLLRQRQAGDWSGVIDAVASGLASLQAQPARQRA